MGKAGKITLWTVGGVGAILVILVVIGNTVAKPPASQPSASVSSTTTNHATAPVAPIANHPTTHFAPATSTRPAVHLTGYGATPDAWDAAHTVDPDFAAGSVYNPDPSLPPVNGHTGAKYTAVQPLGGHVTDYMVNFRSMSLAGAEKIIGAEFPADAQILWTNHLSGCTQVEYASATVHTALGHTDTGDALVEFIDLQDNGAPASDPTTFNQATLSDMAGAQPDPSAGC